MRQKTKGCRRHYRVAESATAAHRIPPDPLWPSEAPRTRAVREAPPECSTAARTALQGSGSQDPLVCDSYDSPTDLTARTTQGAPRVGPPTSCRPGLARNPELRAQGCQAHGRLPTVSSIVTSATRLKNKQLPSCADSGNLESLGRDGPNASPDKPGEARE